MVREYNINLNRLQRWIKHSSVPARSLWPILLLAMLISLFSFASVFAKGGDQITRSATVVDTLAGKQIPKAMAVYSSSSGRGSVAVVGSTNNGNDDYHVAKFNPYSSGIRWKPVTKYAPYGGAGNDVATAVVVDSARNIIVTGNSTGSNNDIHTIKYCGVTGSPSCVAAGKTEGQIIWEHTFDNGGNDSAAAIAVDASDNVYVAGYAANGTRNDDYLIIKYASVGPATNPPAWFELWDDTAYPNNHNRITAITAGAGGIVVTGYSSKNGSTDFDIITRKYGFDKSFVRQWRYSSPGARDDRGVDVKMDTAGNVIMTGYIRNSSNKTNIYAAKYCEDATVATCNGKNLGELAWENSYSGVDNDMPAGLWVTSDGDVYITGSTYTAAGGNDFYTARFRGSDGTKVWDAIYDAGIGGSDTPVGIVVDEAADGGVFVAGSSSNAVNNDFLTLKYKKDSAVKGVLLWKSVWNGPSNKDDVPIGIALESGSGPAPRNVIVSGYTVITSTDYDIAVIKYDYGALNAPTNLRAETVTDTSIRLTWDVNSTSEEQFFIQRKKGESGSWGDITTINPLTHNHPTVHDPIILGTGTTTYTDVDLEANNYYYYQVRAYNPTNLNSGYSNVDRALTRTVSYAAPTWGYTYGGPLGLEDIATAITIDTSGAAAVKGSPVVTGRSVLRDKNIASIHSSDYLTFKLDRSDTTPSAMIWKASYDSDIGNGAPDNAVGVALDNLGNVLVTGSIYSTVYSDDIYTRKVATSGMTDPNINPGLTWDDQYSGSGLETIDTATMIAMTKDGLGSSVVVGYGDDESKDRIYVIKYNPDGSRAWSPIVYSNGSTRSYQATGVAFDSAVPSNIYVSGYSFVTAAPAGSYNWFTAKYNGATGALIWSDNYDVSNAVYGVNGDDKALSIDVDTSGNAYVTGTAKNTAGNTVIYTVKYKGVPAGAPTAERMWNGAGVPFNNPGYNAWPVAVKVDPIDNAVIVGGTAYNSTDSDFHLIRYNPADGSADGAILGDGTRPFWHENFNLPVNFEYATAMTMDASGYIYLTGNTRLGPDTDPDYHYTSDILSVIYDYEGTYLGAMRYPAVHDNRQDEAKAIAANHRGEAFIAGFSVTGAGDKDYTVLKQSHTSLLVPGLFTVTPEADYTKMDLSWMGQNSSDNYHVYRRLGASTDSNDWKLIRETTDSSQAWIDNGATSLAGPLLPGTNYCYTVDSFSGSWNSRKPQMCATTRLDKPSWTATPLTVNSMTQITLNWNTVADSTGYLIERKTDSVGWNPLVPNLSNSAGATQSYPDNTVVAGTKYYYRISANNVSGASLASTEQNATTMPVAPTLSQPSDVSNKQMKLTWGAVTGATSYLLQFRDTTTPGSWTDSNCTVSGCYTDLPTQDVFYEFRVKASTSGGDSTWSNTTTTVKAALAVPTWAADPNPTNITNNSMKLTWVNPVVPGAGTITYVLQYRTVPGSYADEITPSACVGTGSGTTALFCDVTGLTAGTNYAFRVKATNGGSSAWTSTEKTGTAALGVPTLVAPTVASITDTQMTLTWNNNITGATKYTLQRDGVDVPGCTDIAGGSCPVSGLSPNVTYSYRVKSGNATGYSALSNTITAKTILATPNLSSAAGASTASIVLVWTSVSAATGYSIEQSTCNDSTIPSVCNGVDANYTTVTWAVKATVGAVTTTTISGLAAGTNYRYRVTATASGNSSASASNVMHAWTNLPAPILSVTPASSSALTLNWDQQPGETNYTVEVSTTGSGGAYSAIPAATALAANTITYTHSGLALSTEYCYKVKAYSTEANPPPAVYSAPQCKTTPPNAPALSVAQALHESSYTVIEDSTKNWTVADYFINQPVVINSGGIKYTKTIAGNVQTALFVSPAFTTPISQGDSYVILQTVSSVATGNSSDYFFESLSDANKTWGNSKQWIGYKIKILNSVNAANIGQERVITLNSTNSYFMGTPLPAAIVAGDTYQIASFFGAATAAGTPTQLTGSGWAANAWTNTNDGFYLMMTSGANKGHARKIISNTTTTITTEAFDGSPSSGDTYLIAPPARIGSYYCKALAGGTKSVFSEDLTLSGNWGGWGWSADSLKDYYVIMTSGSNKDEVRLISSNTGESAPKGQITVSLPFPNNVAQGDTYLVASAAQIASYRGNASVTGATLDTLVDAANSWGANVWTGGGYYLIMTSGANNGQVRTITGQTSTQLTVAPPFTNVVSQYDSYLISAITATKGSGTITTPVAANPSLPYKGTAKLTLTNGEAEFYSVAPGFGNNYNYELLGMKFPYWSSKVPIAITVPTFQANFQTKVVITKSNYPGMQPNYADIRFYDETAQTELPYWIESTNATTATVWIKTGVNNNVWMYYGNPNAISTSDGTSTFEFFDDFAGNIIDTSKWTVANGTVFTVANGLLKGTNTNGRLTSKTNFSAGVVLEIKSQTNTIAGNGQMIGGFYLDSGNSIGWLNHPGTSYYRNDAAWPQGPSQAPTNNTLYTLTAKNATTVNQLIYNLDTSANFWNIGDATHTLGSKPIALGSRFDDCPSCLNQPYETFWDWVRVRKYAATQPSATAGTTPSSNPWTTDFNMQFDYDVLSGLIPDDASLPYRYLTASYASFRYDFQSPNGATYNAYIHRGRLVPQDNGRSTTYSAAWNVLYDTRTMAGSATPWKSWTDNQWQGYYLQMTSGPNNQRVRKISANTSNSITLESAFPTDPAARTGTAAASGNSNTKLVDSVSTTWAANLWQGYYLTMSDGPNAGQTMKIISSDASSVTVAGTGFTFPIGAGNSYKIFNVDGYRINVIAGNAATNGGTQSRNNNTNAILIDSSDNIGSTLPSKNWATGPDQWAGFYLYISSGPNIGQFRPIIANSANSITVNPPFPYQILSNDSYTIFDPRTQAQAIEAYWVSLYEPVTTVTEQLIIPTADTAGRMRFAKTGSNLQFYTAPAGGAWQLRRQLEPLSSDPHTPILYWIYQMGRLPYVAGTSQRTKIYNFQYTSTPPAATNMNFSSFTPEVGHFFRRPNSVPSLTYNPLETSWNKIDAAINGYETERCPATDHNQPLAHSGVGTCTTFTQAQPADGTTRIVNAASVAGLTAGYTYRFRVRAKYNATDYTAFSDPQWYTVTPPAPTMVTPSVASTTTTQLTPTWNDVSGDNGFKLYWKMRSGLTCTDDNWSGPIILGMNATSYNHPGLTPGTFYCYKVMAIGPPGPPATPDSTFSNIVSQSTKPDAPGVITFSGITASSITLSWPQVSGNNGYQIDRSLDNITWTNNVGSVAKDVITFPNSSGLTSGTVYYYRVSANSAGGFSPTSAAQPTLTTPDATALTLVVVSSDEIDLSWPPVPVGATNYKLQRMEGVAGSTSEATSIAAGGSYSEITNIAAAYTQSYCGEPYPTVACPSLSVNIISYPDKPLKADTTYYYRIFSWNSSGDSVSSGVVSGKTLKMPRETLSATALDGGLRIRLDWSANVCTPACSQPHHYELQRQVRDGIWVTVDNVSATDTFYCTSPSGPCSFVDKLAINPRKLHRYRVRALNAAGTDVSLFSNEATVYAKPFSAVDNVCTE